MGGGASNIYLKSVLQTSVKSLQKIIYYHNNHNFFTSSLMVCTLCSVLVCISALTEDSAMYCSAIYYCHYRLLFKFAQFGNFLFFTVLFPRHTNRTTRDNTINLIHIFRDYLHYHIKCSKAYIHSRMRAKTSDFLKVLNRARPEPKNIEKKTITLVYVITVHN